MADKFQATVTPGASGDVGAAVDAAGSMKKANQFRKAFGLWQQAAGTSTQIMNAEAAHQAEQDQLEGLMAGQELVVQTSQMDAPQKADTFNQVWDNIATGTTGWSAAYQKGYLSATGTARFQANLTAQEQQTNSSIQARVANLQADIDTTPNVDVVGSIGQIAGKLQVPVTRVRDAYIGSYVQKHAFDYSQVKSMEALEALDNDYAEKMQMMSSPELFGTRSTGVFGQLITSAKSQMTNARKAAVNRIKNGAKQRIADATGDTSSGMTSYLVPPKSLEKDIDVAYPDPIENRNQKQKMQDGYEKAEGSREFNHTYQPGDVHPALPEGNTVLKQDRQKMVTAAATQAFNSGDFGEFIRVVNNEEGLTKNIGDTLRNAFVGAETTDQLAPLMSSLRTISGMPGGATALRQSIGDDAYVSMMTVNAMANSMYGGDVAKARQAIQGVDMNIAGIKPDKKLYANIQDYAPKLKTQFHRYVAVMNTMYKIDPAMAEEHYKDVAQFYADQVDKVQGVHVDKSMVADTENRAYEPEKVVEGFIAKFKDETGSEPSRITYLPNGTAYAYDDLGGVARVFDMSAEIEKSNAQYIVEKKNEARLKQIERETGMGKIKQAVEAAPKTAIDSAGAMVVGYVKSVGSLIERFGGYLGGQIDKDINTIHSALGLKSREEQQAASDASYQIQRQAVTEVAEPAFDTMSSQDKMSLRQALAMNSQKKDVAKRVQTKIAVESSVPSVVQSAQRAAGIEDDGIIGTNTKKALKAQGYSDAEIEGLKQGQRQEFQMIMKPLAVKAAKELGIKPEWLMAQWNLETQHGNKVLGGTHNIGNIKGDYNGAFKMKNAWEDVNGKAVTVKSKFKVYPSFKEAVDDYVAKIKSNWPKAVGAKTIEDYMSGLAHGKYGRYATDTNYETKVTDLVNQ